MTVGSSSTPDSVSDLIHLIFLVAMVGIVVGGTVAVIVLWYIRGRDPATGMVAEYVPEPPDDLPPGAAGTLLDEHVDRSDVIATLIGLGRNGAIAIDRIEDGKQHGYSLSVIDPAKVTSRLENDLLNVLFYPQKPEHGMTVDLATIRPRFEQHTTIIRDDLYREMVDRDYFRVSPETTRRRWRNAALIGLAVSVIGGIVLMNRFDAWALFPMVAGILICLILLRMGRAMPQKTFQGSEAAAKWRAFRRYLESIEQRTELKQAQDLFDRYLSYAIAFRIDKDFIKKFAAIGAPAPAWLGGGGFGGDFDGEMIFQTIQMGRVIGHLGGSGAGDIDLPNIGVPDVGMPDINLPDGGLQGAAEALGGGLQGASGGLGDLLDSVGGLLDGIDFDF